MKQVEITQLLMRVRVVAGARHRLAIEGPLSKDEIAVARSAAASSPGASSGACCMSPSRSSTWLNGLAGIAARPLRIAAPLPLIGRMPQHLRAGRGRDPGRVVGGAVVDDDDVATSGRTPWTTSAIRRSLVEGGDERACRHHGDAPPSAGRAGTRSIIARSYRAMNILLLRPAPSNERFGLGPFFRIEPLGMEYIAAALEARGHRVTLRDLRFSPPVEQILASVRPAARRHRVHARTGNRRRSRRRRARPPRGAHTRL